MAAYGIAFNLWNTIILVWLKHLLSDSEHQWSAGSKVRWLRLKITLQLFLGGTSILEVLILHHMYVSKSVPSFIL